MTNGPYPAMACFFVQTEVLPAAHFLAVTHVSCATTFILYFMDRLVLTSRAHPCTRDKA